MCFRRRFFCSVIALLAIPAFCAAEQDEFPEKITVRTVASNLWVPWSLCWGPDNWIWMTERSGMIGRVDPETGRVRRILDLRDSVWNRGESGMMGLALHPDFANTPHVFVTYTWRDTQAVVRLRLERYEYDAVLDTLIKPHILLDSITTGIFRIGSRLLLLPDRTLLMTVGDAAILPAVQDHASLLGKILRLNLDGTAPPDNPWPEAPWPSCLIFSTGHRNPQGLTLAGNGILYSSEHGLDHDDELNLIDRGRNYGWPKVSGPCNDTINGAFDLSEHLFCGDSSVVEPLEWWNPTIGPASLVWYDSPRIPSLTGSLLMAALGKPKPEIPNGSYALHRIRLDPDGRTVASDSLMFERVYGRLRAICVAPDGRVFISTSNTDGRGSGLFPLTTDDRILELDLERSVTSRIATLHGAEVSMRLVSTTVRENVVVDVASDRPAPVRISIVTLDGRRLYDVATSTESGSRRIRVPVGTLPPGIYLMELKTVSGRVTEKFVRE